MQDFNIAICLLADGLTPFPLNCPFGVKRYGQTAEKGLADVMLFSWTVLKIEADSRISR